MYDKKKVKNSHFWFSFYLSDTSPVLPVSNQTENGGVL